MNEWRFQQSPGREFEQSPGRARKGPGVAHTTGGCSQQVWWAGVNAIKIIGGWRPYDWDALSNAYAPTFLYRKAIRTFGYVDEVDPDQTQRARWETEEWWIHPELGDVYKYVCETDLDGVVQSWQRGDDDSITETVAPGPFAPLGVVEGNASPWGKTIDTATKQRWQCTREATGTYNTTDYPELAGTIYQDQPVYTGDYRYDYNVANTYEEWELSDPIDVSDTAAIITAAVDATAGVDLSGSVTVITGTSATGDQIYLPYRIDTWGTASVDVTPAVGRIDEDCVLWRQYARTPTGAAWVNTRITGNSPAGDAAGQLTHAIVTGTYCRAGGCIGANAGGPPIAYGRNFYIGAAPATAIGATGFAPGAGAYGSGIFAVGSKIRVWMADAHCCSVQYSYQYPLFSPPDPTDVTALPSYYFAAGAETWGKVEDCLNETHTSYAYADRPTGCRDQDPGCTAMEEKTGAEVTWNNGIGFVEVSCTWCAATCDVLQCAAEGTP